MPGQKMGGNMNNNNANKEFSSSYRNESMATGVVTKWQNTMAGYDDVVNGKSYIRSGTQQSLMANLTPKPNSPTSSNRSSEKG